MTLRIIIKLGTVTASDIHVNYIDLDHTSRSHRSLITKIINAWLVQKLLTQCPSRLLWRVVRLKVYMTIASPMTLTFIEVHKCFSNLTTFSLAIYLGGMTVDLYMLIRVSATLTLMQGHSGSAKAIIKCWIIDIWFSPPFRCQPQKLYITSGRSSQIVSLGLF